MNNVITLPPHRPLKPGVIADSTFLGRGYSLLKECRMLVWRISEFSFNQKGPLQTVAVSLDCQMLPRDHYTSRGEEKFWLHTAWDARFRTVNIHSAAYSQMMQSVIESKNGLIMNVPTTVYQEPS